MNPNEPEIQAMIPPEYLNSFNKGGGDAPEVNGMQEEWISKGNRQVMAP